MIVFKIYSLVCPKDNTVKYIGCTYHDLQKRLSNNLAAARHSYKHNKKLTKKEKWIIELILDGLSPEIKLLRNESDYESAVKSEFEFIEVNRLTLLNDLRKNQKYPDHGYKYY